MKSNEKFALEHCNSNQVLKSGKPVRVTVVTIWDLSVHHVQSERVLHFGPDLMKYENQNKEFVQKVKKQAENYTSTCYQLQLLKITPAARELQLTDTGCTVFLYTGHMLHA